MSGWNRVDEKLPEEEQLVETMVFDSEGIRNKAFLWRKGSLWFLPDCSMRVYYTPTHWKSI